MYQQRFRWMVTAWMHRRTSLGNMQDYGANLICVEDGIDSSKEAGKLLISIIAAVAEMEWKIIQMIFDRYIHTNDGINGVTNYLNNHGYTKKLRQNGTIPGFSASFIKKMNATGHKCTFRRWII